MAKENAPLDINFRSIAGKYARKMGFYNLQDIEDFVSYATIQKLEGRKSAGLYYLMVDFLRIPTGRKYTNGKINKHYSQAVNIRYPKNIDDVFGKELGESNKLDLVLSFDEMLDTLPQIKRAIVVLNYVWDLNPQEISYCLGVGTFVVRGCLNVLAKKTKK